MSAILHLHSKRSLWISVIALIPALLLVVPGLLQSGFGYFGPNNALDALYERGPVLGLLRSPAVLLGGLFLAFALNIVPAVRLRFRRDTEGLAGVVVFRPLTLHWILAGLAGFLAAAIVLYALFENFLPAVH